MRIAYFDCFAGASGNMIIGSLVDAGLSVDVLQRGLRRLPVGGWSMQLERVHKRSLSALYLDVVVPGEDDHAAAMHGRNADGHHHEGVAHRRLGDVLSILHAAQLPARVQTTAEKIYLRLAQAEALVHDTSAEEVIFHEVGQVDAIIDIAGAALALDLLGIEEVYCSALPCGKGRIQSAHGEMPSPAPATLELLRGVPTYQVDLDAEFVTPTGAAILTSVASFAPRPPVRIEHIGYGSGRSDFPFPNVLRVLIGETNAGMANAESTTADEVVQLETNIDDMNPQLYDFVMERLFASGALDVWTHPVGMKKGRTGMVLAALAPPPRADAVAAAMLAETTTIGVRRWNTKRAMLPRRIELVETSLGAVQVKVVEGPAGRRARPEYDDCQRIALAQQRPLADVMRTIEHDIEVWLRRQTQE